MTARATITSLALFASACGRSGAPPADSVRASQADGNRGARDSVRSVVLNGGAHGMRAEATWLLDDEATVLFAVENTTGVENDPVPDGFVAADDRTGRVVQRDGVWSVAPDSGWQRVRYVRAIVVRPAAGADSVGMPEWRAAAAQVPATDRELLAGAGGADSLARLLSAAAFPASGMGPGEASGILYVAPLRAPAQPDRALRIDGRGAGLSRPQWTGNAVLEIDGALPDAPDTIRTWAGATVINAHDSIRVVRRGATRVVGAGRALSATATGRFILAARLTTLPESGATQPVLILYEVP